MLRYPFPLVPTSLPVRRLRLPTLQLEFDTEREALRLQAEDEAKASDIAPDATVENIKRSKVQIDLHSGREVTEVQWAALLDGSRVLELLYRLEVCVVVECAQIGSVFLEALIAAVATKRVLFR